MGVRTLRYFEVDAFTSELFHGNPAGVCILDGPDWLPDPLMQQIGAENNLAETAFVLPQGKNFGLRWFSPTMEIDLCGHATLASAFVLFTQFGRTEARLDFESRKAGILSVTRNGDILELDFPARRATALQGEQRGLLLQAIGHEPKEILRARDWMTVLDSEDQVRSIQPNFDAIAKLPGGSLIVTAPARDADFVSRFFAPGFGVNEDPVTGSAHCTLIPYWADRLGKTKLHARQVSARGGELFCELRGDRVGIGGHAVLYSEGKLFV